MDPEVELIAEIAMGLLKTLAIAVLAVVACYMVVVFAPAGLQ